MPIAGEGLQWQVAVGVRKGHDSLKADLDRVLDQLKPEITALADKYGFPLGRPVNLDGQRGMLRPRERGVGALQLVQLQESTTRPTPAAGVSPSAGDGLVRLGRSLFNQHCSHCHRMREAAYATITVGRVDKEMPAWKDLLGKRGSRTSSVSWSPSSASRGTNGAGARTEPAPS